jgi:ASCH domain
MKALSIKQPWASLIAHGIKDIENRTWKTHFRGRIFIHASAKWFDKPKFDETHGNIYTDAQWLYIREHYRYYLESLLNPKAINYRLKVSAIIGEVEIIDCVINHESIWAEKTEIQKCNNCPSEIDGFDICCHYKGKKEGFVPYIGKPIYNWVLANPILYDKPILNVKGKLSFWEFNPDELKNS